LLKALDDYGDDDLEGSSFRKSVEFLKKCKIAANSGDKTLVHCKLGVNRR
jgi:protein-tyrosine phosphatase